MKTEVVNVSPKMAIELLKKNTRNRPINANLVNQLVAFIQNDQWKLTHQGIAISQTNNLLDGQHRLLAISRGTKAVPMMIVRGLPDDVMTVVCIVCSKHLITFIPFHDVMFYYCFGNVR